MKKIRIAISIMFLVAGLASVAHADLNSFLHKLNDQAKSDLSKFNAQLSLQFGIPVPKVDAIVKQVTAPADAFMVLQLGQMANKQPEAVVQTYQRSHGKGWGAIAQELGIKPGSPEFHALKRGDFALTGQPGGGSDQGQGQGHGHGKGHGRGHNN